MYQISYAAKTDVGLKRTHNEDSFACYEPDDGSIDSKGSFFVIADGMGGHAAGEVASKLTVDLMIDVFKAEENNDVSFFLKNIFIRTNAEIFRKARNTHKLNGMGTTCTAMIIKNNQAFIAHVGDSRAYIIREGKINQLTEDHSLVWEMMKAGIIDKDQIKQHPQRNVITRSMGFELSVETDIITPPLELMSGDKLILCSDGLNGMVTDEVINNVASSYKPEKACNELVKIANSNGGSDNVTLIIVKVE